MYEKLELNVSSAKQLMELNRNRELDRSRERAAAAECLRLEKERVFLLKESNELTIKSIAEANRRWKEEMALRENDASDLVEVRPGIFGITANLNEVWRRFRNRRSGNDT